MVLNSNQTLLGRCCFALNRHLTDATCLTEDETLALWEWFQRAKQALDLLLTPDHYNFVLLMNVEPHVHAHIIPRYASAREFGGSIFTDPDFGDHYNPAAQQYLEADAFLHLIAKIAQFLPDTGACS